MGIRDQMPIQSRLQTASAKSETTLNLVQTLAGFACFIQLPPSRPKALAILRSPVEDCGFSVGMAAAVAVSNDALVL